MKKQRIISLSLSAAILASVLPVQATDNPVAGCITDFTINESTVSAQIASPGSESATAIAAVFDTAGRLVRTGTAAVSFAEADSVSVEIPVKVYDTESCKLMLLDSLSGLTPLSAAAQHIPERSFTDNLNLRMPEDKNYMYSPLSIKMALAMAANGAEGETQAEILATTGIDNLDDYNTYTKEMIDTYSESEGLSLKIANSLWLNTDKTKDTFSDTFTQKISDYYGGTAQEVNQSNFVDIINGWVSEKTNGKISGIVDESTDFIAYLANAIYFKGSWKEEFLKSATEKEIFTDRDGNETELDFMKRTDMISYYEKDGLQMVRLPYANKFRGDDGYTRVDANVAMYIILSDSNNIDIDKAISEAKDSNGFSSEYVELWLPKFKIEYSTGLIDTLDSMGIKTAFVPMAAQFSPMMTTNEDMLFINSIMHKTYISIDEEGTEAAAVTGIGAAAGAAPSEPTPEPKPIPFYANEPFTFVIRDDSRYQTLFIGEYAFAE